MHTLLETKFFLPELATENAARDRLYARLARGLNGKLTLLCAPAGFGKTSTAAAWLRQLLSSPEVAAPFRAAWYTVDEQDGDIYTFTSYLVASIRTTDTDLLHSWVDLDRRSTVRQPEEIAKELLGMLQDIEGRLVIALDDYHFVADNQVHQLLNHLLRYLPPSVHLVITSRAEPPLRLAPLRLRGEVNELRAAELAFTREEAAAFLHEAVDANLVADAADIVWRQTEGWAAGLRLAAISLNGTADRTRFVREFASSTSRHVADYLVDEVLASQDAAVQHFLLHTSPLDRLSVSLCADVTGISPAEAESMLHYLESRGLFLLPLDDFREWFRYHGQFRSMLYDRLRRQSATAAAVQHKVSGAWFARHGYVEDALHHYVAGGAEDRAADLLEAQIPGLLRAQQWRQGTRWLQMLPQAVVQTRPQLLLLSAWLAYNDSNLAKVRALVEQVEQVLGADGLHDPGEDASWNPVLGQVHAFRMSSAFEGQSAEEVLMRGRRALALLPPPYDMVRAHVLNHVGQYTLLRDGYEAAVSVLQNELNGANTQPSEYVTRLLYAVLVLHFLAGRVDDMERTAQQHAKLALATNVAAQIQTSRLARGLARYERSDCREALRQLSAIFEQPDLASFQTLRLASVPLLEMYAAQNRQHEARTVVEVLRDRLSNSPDSAEQDDVEAIAAYSSILCGGVAPVDALIRGSTGKVWYTQAPYRDAICVRLLQTRRQPGDLEQALAIIEKSLVAYATKRDLRGQIGMWVLAAQSHWLLGRQVHALQWLRRALDVGYDLGWRRTFTQPGALMGEMLHKLAREEAYAAAAGSLLAEIARPAEASPLHPMPRGDAPKSSADQHALLIDPLSDREVEVLNLLAHKLTNKEIAGRLSISPLTVRNHTVRIYDKLHVRSRGQAVARAQQLGVLAMP
jgi:LuxR family maltose regulon positive regulatory protein